MTFTLRELPLTVEHPGGGSGSFLVRGLWLAPAGFAFEHRGYLHLGTQCWVTLPTTDPHERVEVYGKVSACAYTGNQVHHVALSLSQAVDPALFVPSRDTDNKSDDGAAAGQLIGRALLICGDDAMGRIVQHHLRRTSLHLEVLSNLAQLSAVLNKSMPQLVVIDASRVSGDLAQAIQLLTEHRVSAGLIVLIGMSESIASSTWTGYRGSVHRLIKPFRGEQLLTVVQHTLGTAPSTDSVPLRSQLADMQDSARLLAWYQQHVREVMTALKRAVGNSDLNQAMLHGQFIQETGVAYGYEPLTLMAGAFIEALRAKSPPDRVLAIMNKLNELIGRMQ